MSVLRISRNASERKRQFEIAAMVIVTALLIGISRLETRLFELAERLAANKDFLTTVIYFSLINLNVILILVLGFLMFRNVAKLVVERRRGVLGSRLRTKLVVTLVFFAVAPTALFFYVTTRFITTSFDEWFSEKVRTTMQQTREAGAQVYKRDQRRMESLARIALQRIEFDRPNEVFLKDQTKIRSINLGGFESEYGIEAVTVFAIDGRVLWASHRSAKSTAPVADEFVTAAIERFQLEPSLISISTVEGLDQKDVVKGVAPIFHPISKEMLAVVQVEERFETQILKSIETILKDFADLRPNAQLVRISYTIILVVMTLLVMFSAVWLGFYVARGITGPIQNLAEATREVALGNYDVTLMAKTDDETGQLVRAFNQMTKDLLKHKRDVEESRVNLERTNEELDRRRRYMEVVLKNITAGVIAADARGRITSINSAAERLLQIDAHEATGRDAMTGLGETLYRDFWQQMTSPLTGRSSFRGQINLDIQGRALTLISDATRIHDENLNDLGVVLVFDDATEQVAEQRVAAWREVARRIAHEIKNPITPIKLSAERLLRRFGEQFQGEQHDVFKSCVETILVQVDSLRDLVNEFSRFSRLPRIQPRLLRLNEVIQEVITLFQLSYPDVTFDVSEMEMLPDMMLDKDQMNRVFVNLVTNAIDATKDVPGGAVISFKTKVLQEVSVVRIEVSDNGSGIPQKLKDRVMEPYFSTKPDGTGLGLAIVNQIVTDHRGYLRLADHRPRGTTVIIELPISSASPEKV